MRKQYLFGIFTALIFTLSSCSKKIYPDRTLFLKDGEPVPTVQLQQYKSVQERPAQDKNAAVALAISGGGSRASNLGVGVMLGLEQLFRRNGNNVLQEIDYLSTVSGGGFAGGAYVYSLFEHYYSEEARPYSLQHYVDKNIKKELEHSYMGSILKNYLNPKLWFTFADDGDALEKAIDDHVLGRKRRQSDPLLKDKLPKEGLTLGEMFIAKDSARQVQFPMMFANGAILDKMVIFPFSPDILQQYQICGCTHRMKKSDPVNPYDVPLSVGIKASGSFPVLISNTTLVSEFDEKRKYLHVVDGGLADNYGYETALDVLSQEDVPTKVMFIVDANNARMTKTFSKKQRGRNMFKVYAALPYSGLDAKSVTLKPEVYAESSSANVEPIFFGFDVLLKDNYAAPPKYIEVKKAQKRIIRELQTNMHNISDADLQVLYELLINIGTKYTITPEEQDLLLLAGQKIVFMQKEEIMRALGG